MVAPPEYANRRRRHAAALAVLARCLLPAIAATWVPPAALAADPVTLSVFAAASLAEAFAAVKAAVEREHPEIRVELNFAGSQQLALQIEQGAAADVFASADERWMARLRDRGRLAGQPLAFAHNRLVVIVPQANPGRVETLHDLARPGVGLVLAADAVPAGRYARAAFDRLARLPGFEPDYAGRVLRNVVSEEENVRAVVAKVQLGEADAGVVYRSDVTPPAGSKVRVIDIPAEAGAIAGYFAAVLEGPRRAAAARVFVDTILSPEGRRILREHGFIPGSDSPAH